MISKLTRILIVTLILFIAIAVIYLNPDEITVNYGPATSFSAMGGVVYLVCFAIGVALSLFLWVVYGIKTYMRERALISKGQQSQQFFDSVLEARGLLAAKENKRAKDRWQKLIKRDPTNIIARVELSRSLEQDGHPKEALKTLDQARTTDPTNTEVLLRASELHVALGNKTAAIDNLALVLYHHPNTYAAKLARDLSEQLGRIEDAIEYNKQYESLGGARDHETMTRLEYGQLAQALKDAESKEKIARLKKFVSSNRHFVTAAQDLAALELNQKNVDEAAEVLIRAAKDLQTSQGNDPHKSPFQTTPLSIWRKVISLWISQGADDRALSVARTAAKSIQDDDDKIDASLDVARLELMGNNPEGTLQQLENVERELDAREGALNDEPLEHSKETLEGSRSGIKRMRLDLLALRGSALSQLERYSEAKEVLARIAQQRKSFSGEVIKNSKAIEKQAATNGVVNQPAPELSTP